MEQRNPLSQGTQVNRFVIDRVIGYGASCLVYEAHYLDSGNHRKEIILKECYPYNSSTTRIGSKIVWSSSEEQEKAFWRFNNAYEIAAKIQNEAGAQSVSVYSLDKFEENGTQYVATIPNGTSYDKNESKDITDIIRTALALTNAIGFYHKAGYLHLDIKPSNFIATEDQTGKGKNIVLFDVDTVVSQNDIQEGNLRSVSYSKECAAPEQKMQQIKKLCPATDLFAVGAVLFERIMNRPADSSDSTLFAEWEFGSRFEAKKVNPKAKRLLTEIFHKTLAANVKRRYQSAEELANALDELLSVVTNGKSYLVSNISNTVDVIGRRNDIDLISKEFLSGKRFVFLHGVGGIGKSTLAVAYANEYKKNYDAVLFLRYRDSLVALLDTIEIHNFEAASHEEKRKVLRGLLDQNVLIIIDNFDVHTDQDEYLYDLLQYHTNIIFTTRTDFSDTLNGDATQIEVNALGQSFLFELFSHISKTDITDENEKALKEMFRLVGNNTYAVELLARQITASDCTIETLAKKVADGLYGLNGLERIRSNKDGRIIKKTVPDIIRSLYNMANLNENQKQVLRNLYLLRFLNIDKQTYLEFCWPRPYNMDIVNDLVEIGWVQKNNRYYYLHPLVEELVNNELKPCEENCWQVFSVMRDRMSRCLESYGKNIKAEERAFEMNCMISAYFLAGINLEIESNCFLAVKWLISLIENNDTYYGFPDIDTITPLLSKLNQHSHSSYTFEIKYIIFSVWLYEFRIIYLYDSEQHSKRRIEELYRSFSEAKESISSLTKEKQQEALARLYSVIGVFLDEYSANVLPNEFIILRYNEHPELFEHNPIEHRNEIVDAWEERNNQPTEAEIVEKNTILEYSKSNDKIALIKSIADSGILSLYEKAERIGYCTEMFFDHPYLFAQNSQDDWQMIKDILSIEEATLKKCLRMTLSNHKKEECYSSLKQNYCNNCVVSAVLNQRLVFKKYVNLLFELTERETDWYFNNPEQPISSIWFDMPLVFLWEFITKLRYLFKCSWLLPYLVEYGEKCRLKFSDSSFGDEEVLISVYNPIVTCAKNASDEPDIQEIQKKEYRRIAKQYEKQINIIQDVDFSFKSDDE